jgi:hypothetical protein
VKGEKETPDAKKEAKKAAKGRRKPAFVEKPQRSRSTPLKSLTPFLSLYDQRPSRVYTLPGLFTLRLLKLLSVAR